MIIAVASGKGGTGKTSVTAALAHLASLERTVVLADADVYAANLGITARPTVLHRHEFEGGRIAVVDESICEQCGECVEACRFGAIQAPGVVAELGCEGCAACYHRCPVGAISMRPEMSGEWYESDTRFGRLFHARLHPGRENSGKLVTTVRTAARDYAEREGIGLVLVDGPPGIGCPVIAASTGCDLALLVAEPTVSGAEDLDRALGALNHFVIPALTVVNKSDLNPTWTERIEQRCRDVGVDVAGQIPFDPEVTRAMVRLDAPTEARSGPAEQALRELWTVLRSAL